MRKASNSNNKIKKNNSKPKQKRPLTTKNNYRINPNILASDETKKLYQKLNAYPNYKFIKQLSTEKLALYLNNYNPVDINIITKILQKYFYFQQITLGAFEPKQPQAQNTPQNYNIQLNYNTQKKRNSKSLGKAYKNTNQKESEKIQAKQKIFSSLQKHLSQSKNILSLVVQSFKINQDIAKNLSKGISENKSLQYFSLNFNVLTIDTYEIILKGLLTHEIIRCIDLSNNKLNDKYSPMISRIIQRQGQRRDQIIWSYQLRNELPSDNNYKIGLISINLHDNQLGKQSAEIIANTLSNDQYIRYIDLSKNYFDNGACKLFVHMMRKNNTLLTVDLRENIGYDEFINPRIVMKMSKNIKYLYSQYQNGQYTEEEFQYLKGFIDISFFDVDIPQEIVEYYNTNVQQTDVNNPNEKKINNNIKNNNDNEMQNIINNMNNLNYDLNKNINNNVQNNVNNNVNNNIIINNEQEENEEEQGAIKNSIKNINKENKEIITKKKNNINQIKNVKNNENSKNNKNKNVKENSTLKENQKLIQENLQLKQEILELKAKNLQKMLSDGLVVPQEEEKDLENYYNRANEIIDTLNEVMAKLQKHKELNNNNQNINVDNLNIIKKEDNIIAKDENFENNINNNLNINSNKGNKDENNLMNLINNQINNINQINDNKNININKNDANNNQNNKKKENNKDNIFNNDKNVNEQIINNIDNKTNINNINNSNKNINNNSLINEKDVKTKEKETPKNIEDKNVQKVKEQKEKKESKIEEDKNKYNINENNNNNMKASEEEDNDFNLDGLTEEEKIDLLQKRELLMKLQEEAEARGEHFDIQEYLAQLEEGIEDDDEEEEFGHHNQNNNKLNKSF